MKVNWDLDLGVKALDARRQDGRWIVRGGGEGGAVCPGCGSLSRSRKARYCRRLQDLPMQGSPVTLSLELGLWRCRTSRCCRASFVATLPGVAPPHARRTRRVVELAILIGHSAGGRPAERILRQLGLPQSDDTVLRSLKANAGTSRTRSPTVVGIDDWSWLKGRRYGIIVVDLERRVVVDVLPERSAEATADWLSRHPEVEVVSRDRCGLYAQGAARGVEGGRTARDPITPATMAEYKGHGRQSELLHHRRLAQSGRRAQWQAKFDRLKELQRAGRTASSIKHETGLHWKTITKWLPLDSLPERRAEGHKSARHLLPELQARGYAGSQTHLERLLGRWRRADHAGFLKDLAGDNTAIASPEVLPLPPIPAASLCIKPTKLLTDEQSVKVTQLKRRRQALQLCAALRCASAASCVAKIRTASMTGWMMLIALASMAYGASF